MSWPRSSVLNRRGSEGFLDFVAVAQFAGYSGGYAVTRFQTFSHFEAPPSLVLGLPGRTNLLFGDVVSIEHKDLVNAVAVIDCLLGNKDCFLFFLTWHGGLHEKPRLQPAVFVLK